MNDFKLRKEVPTSMKGTLSKKVLQVENSDVSAATGLLISLQSTYVFVGDYVLNKDKNYTAVRVNLTKKPHWFHRAMMRLFFGIIWEDKK